MGPKLCHVYSHPERLRRSGRLELPSDGFVWKLTVKEYNKWFVKCPVCLIESSLTRHEAVVVSSRIGNAAYSVSRCFSRDELRQESLQNVAGLYMLAGREFAMCLSQVDLLVVVTLLRTMLRTFRSELAPEFLRGLPRCVLVSSVEPRLSPNIMALSRERHWCAPCGTKHSSHKTN